jgi:hypothetical protein
MQKPKACRLPNNQRQKRQSQRMGTKPPTPQNRNHRTKRRKQSQNRSRRDTGRPPPNLGGYGPFSIYPCQAPNGWLRSNLWTTQKSCTHVGEGLNNRHLSHERWRPQRPDHHHPRRDNDARHPLSRPNRTQARTPRPGGQFGKSPSGIPRTVPRHVGERSQRHLGVTASGRLDASSGEQPAADATSAIRRMDRQRSQMAPAVHSDQRGETDGGRASHQHTIRTKQFGGGIVRRQRQAVFGEPDVRRRGHLDQARQVRRRVPATHGDRRVGWF